MTDEMNAKRGMDEALQTLRAGYEQNVDLQKAQPEPIVGKELGTRRFPKVVSYLAGALAVGMLVTAVYLFGAHSQPAAGETVGSEGNIILLAPTPPIFAEPVLLSAPDDIIPSPPQPTPWPTPPIAPGP